MKRLYSIIASVFIFGVIAMTGCAGPGPEAIERVRSVAGGWLAALQGQQREAGPAATPNGLVASGTIEAPFLAVGSPLGGRITRLAVVEGQTVQAGELIAELDTALLDAEIAQAEAARRTAQAQVALLEAPAREADLDVARAAIKQAEAASAAARVAWQDATTLITATADLDVRIIAAETGLRVAEEQVKAAQAAATAADLEMQLWGRTVKSLEDGFDVRLPSVMGGSRHVDAPADKLGEARLQWNLASQRTWEAHAKAETVQAARNVARQTLTDLRGQKADPQALKAQADTARAAYNLAEAAVGAARANLAVLQAGAPAEQIAAARAVVDRAESTIRTLQARQAQARMTAPEMGTVTSIILRQGEVAAPAAAIVQISQPAAATLTVYVPEPEMSQVQPGQDVAVSVDAFPGRIFSGAITQVADRAEFTPKNVQTHEERADTVFAVKIRLADSGGLLKAGMPADARFGGARGQVTGELIGPSPRPSAPQGAASTGSATVSAPRALSAPQDAASTGSATVSAPRALSAPQGAPATHYAGTIEATDVIIAGEMGGRVRRAFIAEGDSVRAGQIAVELDAGEWQARRDEAEAAVAAARAELARVLAAPQSARLAQAGAQVAQAQAALAVAQTALTNARVLRATPQELDAQIHAAQAQVEAAAAQANVARAQLKTARVLQESVQPGTGSDQDRTRRAMYDQNVAAAEALVRSADVASQGAQATLAVLLKIRQQPAALDAAVHKAEGGVSQAQAAVAVAEAALAQVKAPPQTEAVAVAQARVAQAEAGLAAVDVALDKLTVRSPATGTVTAQAIHTGEVAAPGIPLFTVTDIERARLVIYVPADQIGEVRLGQPAIVTVDAYRDRTFAGAVTRIADHAEFTPKNVQTQDERARTVFAVEIALMNEMGLLRPGMPAEATLAP